jgi:DNA-binding CsgD family transcriptional regulator
MRRADVSLQQRDQLAHRADLVTIGSMAAVAGSQRLLERDVELARLSALLASALAGNGAVVTIEGPAGIGKTALLDALHGHAAERGVRSLRARGRVLEAGMAFAMMRQLMEPVVLSVAAADRRRLLAGPARFGAGALGLPGGAVPDSEFAAVHGLYWLLANLAERTPLLLTIDDVQWADAPSLSWLAYLAPRTVELPVLVVMTAREGDPRVRVPAVDAVLSDSAAHRFALSALSPASAGTLVRRDFGRAASAGFCAACWELTGGNPLYVRELLAAARNERLTGTDDSIAGLHKLASSAVGASVLARMARLGPDALELAKAVAVLGSQHEVAVAAELAGLDPADAELVADELAAAQILAPARPLDYFHPLIAEAVYTGIPLGARRLAHRRAASILDRTGAADSVAAHLLMTGPVGDPWVTQRLSDAARFAREHGAPEVAASYLRRALAEPPAETERPGLLLRLGQAEWYTGQPDAITHLEAATDAARDVSTLAAAAGALANAYVLSDKTDLGVRVLQRAIGAIGPTDPVLALRLEGASALAGVVDDRTAPAANQTADLLRARIAELPDPPVRLLVAVAEVAMRRAEADQAAEEMIKRALARMHDPLPLNVCTSIIVTLSGLEVFGALDGLCEDMMTAARRRSALQEMVGIASFSSWALIRQGELADAEAQARWALERATGIYALDSLAHLVEVLVERDALDDAEAELARMEPPLASHSIMAVTYLMSRGRLRAAQERHAEALQDFLACGERCELLGIVLALYHWRSAAANAHASLGHTDEARRLAREEVEIARAFGRPRALGVALRCAGLVEILAEAGDGLARGDIEGHAAGAAGGESRGLTLLAEAVTVLESSQAPVELARTITDFGAALRRAGQRGEARAQLERALDLAHRCGARRIAGRARSELVAAGAKPRRDAMTGRDALTASELRVARLAASGRTNREIAQALFITTKTASAHLSRVYRKLDITRRDQLAEALVGTAPDAAQADSEVTAAVEPATDVVPEPELQQRPGAGSSRISSGAGRKTQG